MAGGTFVWDEYRFQIENGSELIGLRESLVCEDLDLKMQATNKLPALNGAPVASWVLARLLAMTDNGFEDEVRERNDGGGFVLEFVVYKDTDTPVASFQLQGNTEGIAMLGERSGNHPNDQIVHAFVSAVVESPMDLKECRHLIKDPEWQHEPGTFSPTPVKGSTNQYGWDGSKFLGRDNIRMT